MCVSLTHSHLTHHKKRIDIYILCIVRQQQQQQQRQQEKSYFNLVNFQTAENNQINVWSRDQLSIEDDE